MTDSEDGRQPRHHQCMFTSTENSVDWDDLINLFRPGDGDMPPKLSGWELALKE